VAKSFRDKPSAHALKKLSGDGQIRAENKRRQGAILPCPPSPKGEVKKFEIAPNKQEAPKNIFQKHSQI
jgi:hypothetical protein